MADTLNSGDWLRPGQKLQSKNGFHVLAMQEDGNLVLYSLNRPVWASNTDGKTVDGVVLQDDGNLVIYAPGLVPVWATGTDGRGKSGLVVQGDRNAVIYDSNNHPTWSSGTHTSPDLWETRQIEMSPELMAAIQQDAAIAPMVSVGVVCQTSPQGIIICVAAMVVIAVILEFTNGKPPFGPNNDLRVIGGQISDNAKQAGKDLSDWSKGRGGAIAKTWKKWF
jgi:hypothetical protein